LTEQPPNYPPPGYPPPPARGYGYPPPQSVGVNAMAVASLVCSLFGWVCLFIGAFLGVIFGFIALGQIKRTGQRGRGMAIAGIIIGIVLIVGVAALWTVAAVLNHSPSMDSGAPPVAAQLVVAQAV
jgi:Domain of unknown function (DUF4190)